MRVDSKNNISPSLVTLGLSSATVLLTWVRAIGVPNGWLAALRCAPIKVGVCCPYVFGEVELEFIGRWSGRTWDIHCVELDKSHRRVECPSRIADRTRVRHARVRLFVPGVAVPGIRLLPPRRRTQQ
jgi:hypothetical protein